MVNGGTVQCTAIAATVTKLLSKVILVKLLLVSCRMLFMHHDKY